jgi:hypothetical protein
MAQTIPVKCESLLDAVGGEPLEASGFEDEQPENGFDEGGDDGND